LPNSSIFHPIVDPARRPIAGSLAQDQFDLDSPWHHHDVHQLQYAFEGALEVEDATRRSYLPRQLAAWIPAGVVHRTSLHRVRSGSVMLAPELVPNAGKHVCILQVSPLMREMVIGAMRWQITAPLDTTGDAYFRALAMLCREWIESTAPLSLPTSSDPQLRAAMEYTRADVALATIAGASAAVGLSERSLRRRFEALGMSWEAYRRSARLLAAVGLLEGTTLSVQQIAERVGYESQSAFAKTFRGALGMSPRAFRRAR
jgi:AraC-like DNA-binding protein